MSDSAINSPPAKLEGLQVLRFVAAFLVMCAHVKFVWRDDETPWFWDTAGAACGVDIFFVISGFVISMTADRARSAQAFLMDRFFRVLPLYILMSFVIGAKRILIGEGVTINAIVNSVLFLPILDAGRYTNTIHPYGWSIAYEMWFYLLLSIALLFSSGRRASLYCATVLFVGSVLVLFLYDSVWLLPDFLFNPLVLEFSAGCLLYHFREKIGRYTIHASIALPLFALGVCATSFLGYHLEIIADTGLGGARALIWGGFAVSVFILFYSMEKRVRWPRFLVVLGTASYSIYMIQPLTLRLASGLDLGANLRMIFFICVTTLGGWISYILVERPLLVRSKSWLSSRSAGFNRKREG